jgi:hypothetical protein
MIHQLYQQAKEVKVKMPTKQSKIPSKNSSGDKDESGEVNQQHTTLDELKSLVQ